MAERPDADQSWWKIIPLCGIDHDEYHALLDEHVRCQDVPSWEVRRTYGYFVRGLVAQAWEHRVPGRTPYTVVQA